MNPKALSAAIVAASLAAAACGDAGRRESDADRKAAARPSILLVTLDTTRADAIGPEAAGVETPAFNALAARGRRFRQAYATVPETLPSHVSILTGLYPAGHGVHENARSLAGTHAVLAEQLRNAGYRTAAVVSSFVLARQFGLARGFDLYAEQPAPNPERTAKDATAAALVELQRPANGPRFLWVHYFDPHYPYAPPEPFRSRYRTSPYLGEVASMDHELGRLVTAFEQQVSREGTSSAIIVAGDHGEGLGDHGESQHGHLLYQSTMHVPLVVVGPGSPPGIVETPVSIRRIYHTVLAWARVNSEGATPDLLASGEGKPGGGNAVVPEPEVVLGEAMKPYLEYGWQPQVMSVDSRYKAILSGKLETYDLAADAREQNDLGGGANVPARTREALEDYPVPALESAGAPANLDDEARRRLASLGYVSAGAAPVVRKDAPRAADMLHVLGLLETASGLFVNEKYAAVIPLLEKILVGDPHNLDAILRLATAHSALGHDELALAAFRRARQSAPRSPDVDVYLALHYARGSEWARAVPMLERIVAESPDRLPALEALAGIRVRQGRVQEAVAIRQKLYSLRAAAPVELLALGQLAMNAGQTAAGIQAYEQARVIQGSAFERHLELGVLYLDARRFEDARASLDRVPASSPDYPMALFKRAQVSVLLGEPDRAARIAAARARADRTTSPLIARERLFSERR